MPNYFPSTALVSASAAWASLPAASGFAAGKIAYVSDVGASGSYWVSDGTIWRPLNGCVMLFNTAIPVGLPGGGSIGNNGALTLTTALQTTYSSIYLYFPANAISAGSAAGIYYVVMSSTTAGTIYNNTYTGERPTVPSSPTAFSTTGPGAYTQTVGSDITMYSVTIKGGTMGLDGCISVPRFMVTMPATSGSGKLTKTKLGSTTDYSLAHGATTVFLQASRTIVNRGVANQQIMFSAVALSTTSPTFATENTSVDVTYTFTAQIATSATEYMIFDAAIMELTRP